MAPIDAYAVMLATPQPPGALRGSQRPGEPAPPPGFPAMCPSCGNWGGVPLCPGRAPYLINWGPRLTGRGAWNLSHQLPRVQHPPAAREQPGLEVAGRRVALPFQSPCSSPPWPWVPRGLGTRMRSHKLAVRETRVQFRLWLFLFGLGAPGLTTLLTVVTPEAGNAWAVHRRRRHNAKALSLRGGLAPGLMVMPGPESALLGGGAPTGGGEGACPAPDLPTPYRLGRASPRQHCAHRDCTVRCWPLPP